MKLNAPRLLAFLEKRFSQDADVVAEVHVLTNVRLSSSLLRAQASWTAMSET